MVTYNAEHRIKQSAFTVPNWVKNFVIVNDGTPYSEDSYPKGAHIIQHETNKSVGAAKTTAIKYLLENTDCEHIFLMEDDIIIKDVPNDIELKKARLQVGVAVPEREKILQALGRGEGGQPAPGMSTKPPEKRISTGDEMGTGVGEATPMVVPHRRILMLESLRVLDFGKWVDINSNKEKIKLFGPEDNWPSSIYSSLITIHWELIIDAIKKGYKTYLLFVIQREDCESFQLANDIDPEYSKFLTKSVKKNLKILCYDCKFSAKGIKLNREIKFKIT